MRLRGRIAATIAGIVLVAVAALGLAVHALVVLDRVDSARDDADDRIRAAAEIWTRTGLLAFDARLDRDLPAPLAAEVDAAAGDGARATYVAGPVTGTREVWAAVRVDGRVLSTHTQVRPTDAQVRTVDRALVAAGAVTVVLAALVGLLSADRLARRLGLAAQAARAVRAAPPGTPPRSLRAAVGGRQDEVADLADAVDAMAVRLAARLRAEQRFTADVAHDLRTPVTGLVTAAALLPDDDRPAQLVRDRAGALARLVEELLEVARLDAGEETAEVEPVDLADVLRRAVERGVAAGELPADTVGLDVERGTVVRTDPRRLQRAVSNLVRNALAHGAPPVVVRQRGAVVEVRDHGPGFSSEVLADGPRRFRRSTSAAGAGDSHGLGLVIAAGQVGVLGGELELANAPEGGAVARLVLPDGDLTEP